MTIRKSTLSSQDITSLNQYWSLANYLSVGQIYLLDNPLLKQPLTRQDVKPRLLGHWGTTPGLNLIYAHLNRLIARHQLNMIYVTGPGHGGPALVANTYIEGSYSHYYPAIQQNESGLKRLFKQFSFPGGVPSHVAPEIPGSINEGGELGYALSHAFGAVFDNPDLIATCVIGDGEAETGPLAAAWHSNKFLNPASDGAVLPILHLNGYKIANPTIFARIPKKELNQLLKGYGYQPIWVESSDVNAVHQLMSDALIQAVNRIQKIQVEARTQGITQRPIWPMIVMKTPKGWTGPKSFENLPVEDSWRSHQVPFKELRQFPERIELLEAWLRSYNPEQLFDSTGRIIADINDLIPEDSLQMGRNPHANGGVLMQALKIPGVGDFAVDLKSRGSQKISATRVMGTYLAEVMRLNESNFRVFGPDETASNRLDDLYQVTAKTWVAEQLDSDEDLAMDGRVMEILSEHTCQGWLEGYLLSGRHGLFSCYEAFINIVSSMATQHAKWLQVASQKVNWRQPIPSLNYLLTSHVWRQDHNGFSHQDPGFINHLSNKEPNVVRLYFPPDTNCLLAVTQKILQTTDKINVVVAGKQLQPQWLAIDEAQKHCDQGLGIWHWASNTDSAKPDLIIACAGDVPTIEALAATKILNQRLPDLSIRFVNVVDIMTLAMDTTHPHGISDDQFRQIFSSDAPVILAFHGYPSMIHRLIYNRPGHENFHIHGFNEEGTTTTPFDMLVLNQLDRYHLVKNAVNRLQDMTDSGAILEDMDFKLAQHHKHILQAGDDLPDEIFN
ncbi:phosphoketolase family protein [Marinicella gelatinilytica]|uniref:phosphoketolase family protein n=1 Tax=Marinicella gelatinilytica TaxID=2996017 RepID=UPI002260B0D5|nr:phosphoketolase family protein [Marinicella gelatinilytica]MCX7546094.1 phosphoketolase family protein [Marinicella gelatinilytica]